MSILFRITPPRIGCVKVVRAQEAQGACHREHTCYSADALPSLIVFISSDPVHDVHATPTVRQHTTEM
jgi:hypothetical protein